MNATPSDSPSDQWKVHVTVCGNYAGAYDGLTREAAEELAASRGEKYGRLGCHYRVEQPKVELPGDPASGNVT